MDYPNTKLQRFLAKHEACERAREEVGERTLRQAWDLLGSTLFSSDVFWLVEELGLKCGRVPLAQRCKLGRQGCLCSVDVDWLRRRVRPKMLKAWKKVKV